MFYAKMCGMGNLVIFMKPLQKNMANESIRCACNSGVHFSFSVCVFLLQNVIALSSINHKLNYTFFNHSEHHCFWYIVCELRLCVFGECCTPYTVHCTVKAISITFTPISHVVVRHLNCCDRLNSTYAAHAHTLEVIARFVCS